MSAAPTTAIHAALSQALSGVQAAGGFRVLTLADERGFAWALAGEIPAPDLLAAVPSLLSRAFQDRQPLLRFFSDKLMRFEYRSDTMAYIKAGQNEPGGTDFILDVPGAKDAREKKDQPTARDFIVGWGEEFLVLRELDTDGKTWCLLGITPDAASARTALQKAVPAISTALASIAGSEFPTVPISGDQALHPRLMETLEAFRSAAPDIQMAAVTSKDGFVVAALDGGTLDPDLVAPLMGHSFLAIQESTQRLCGSTECVLLRMEEGILLARELTDDLLFAALLAPTACTGLILRAFETAAGALRAALNAMTSAVAPSQAMAVPQDELDPEAQDCEVAV